MFRLALQPRPTRLRAGLVALVTGTLLALTALSCASDSKAARPLEIAIQDDPVFLFQSYFNRERAFRHARNLGVTRLKINANWAFLLPKSQRVATTRPANPGYNFAQIDDAVRAAARYGIQIGRAHV